jgi:hypothetical protein
VRSAGFPCQVTAMEESQQWFNEIRRLVPPSLAEYVDIRLSPTEDRPIGNAVARVYSAKPQRKYAFVFIDGPQLPANGTSARCFDGDILDVCDWNSDPFVAFLDGRAGTRSRLAELIPAMSVRFDSQHNFSRLYIPGAEQRVAREGVTARS